MPLTTGEIAERLEGKLEGDPSIEISGLAGLAEAGEGDISFLSNPRYTAAVAETSASAVIVDADWKGASRAAIIRTENADAAFSAVAGMLVPGPPAPEPGMHDSAVVAADVSIEPGVSIGPCCVIEQGVRIGATTIVEAGCYVGRGCIIGSGCRLYPNVSVREGTEIGDRVIVHMGAVVGSDGFGYVQKGSVWEKIPQVGTVKICDDVEIGANVAIDRARFGKTIIGKGAKIDNLVQVAHNVSIGDNTAIAGLVGIAGSTTIGNNVMIGGCAGFAGHLNVGDFSVVGAGAGVTKDVPPKTFVSGFPAMPHTESQQMQALVRRLPGLRKKLLAMEKQLKQLEAGEQ